MDPVRHVAYVMGTSSVYVLSGTSLVSSIPVGAAPYGAAVNPVTGVLYPTFIRLVRS